MESSNEKSTEDSNNEKNSSNPKQPGEADSGASCSGNQTKQYKGSSKTFKIAELKAISVCINRQSKNFSQQDIKRAIEDPSLITIKRRPGEGSVPLFDRKEVKNHINLPLEIDLERPKKKRRKRSKSRDRSSSPYRRKHRSPYSTSPDRKYRSHRSRRSESAEERRRRRARSHSRSTSSEKRHYVSKRSHTGDRKNDHSSSSDSSDENSRSERRRHYRDRRERDSRYYQDIIPPREMMMAHHGPMMPRMMMNPMMPWGYPPYPRPPVRGMPPFRPPWETMRPTIVYNSRPPKPVAIEASTSENSTNVVPTTTTS